MLRDLVTIDEDSCDGCGRCIPACHEGALRIIDGKARLVSDRLCDGLGACLGHCPRGAIRIERRDVPELDKPAAEPMPSALRQWPVQLHLVSPTAPYLRRARLLVAADCVPVAYGGFHAELLLDHAVLIACPKLDDTQGYVEKLAEMIRLSDLQEITVVHMEVPCCTGILRAVLAARQAAQSNLPVNDIMIGIQGQLMARRQISADTPVPCDPQPVCCHMREPKGVH